MKFKKFFKILVIISLVLGVLFLSGILIFFTQNIKEVRNLNIDISPENIEYCTIYDNNNNEISNIDSLSNNYIKYEDINEETISAFICIEDKDFFKHNGLNYKRMIKAIINNIKAGKIVEGASTISQQLIKNKFLTNEKTLSRKIKEAYLTKKLEANEDKDKIMEAYLNTIYYGNGAYGIGNASIRFFNKKPKDLTLSESCILAGIVKSPSQYSPINNIEKCKNRRNLVLKEMYEDKLISEEEYEEAINEEIILNVQEISGLDEMDLYSRNVLHEASKILNLDIEQILRRGYKIYTYQDNDIQEKLNTIINDEKYYHKNQYGNIADSLSIVIDNKSGGVSAVAGKSKYNLIDFKRQPGSLVKPVLVYTPALEEKLIYPCSEILDEKITIDGYTPRNVSDKYYGYVSIKEAIALSLNTTAVKLCNELGINKCKEYGEKCGLKFDDNGLAIALGGLSNGFTLQNITESYLPYTNNGNYKKSTYIKKIYSPYKSPIYNNILSLNKYCSSENAYLTTKILNYSTKYGTSKKLANCKYDIAGKTGTVNIKNSNLNTDAYSLAYTSEHTMSVWLGNYSMQKEYNLDGSNNGGTYATEIIRDTFNLLYNNHYPEKFIIPENIVELPIDTTTLEKEHKIVIGKNIPERFKQYEYFSSNNIPSENSNLYENIPETVIETINNKNSITIKFDTLDYINYKLYKVLPNGKKILLCKVNDHNGEYYFIDNSIEFNTEYKYYIISTSDYSKSEIRSDSIIGFINKDYNTLLDNHNDNVSWLFG